MVADLAQLRDAVCGQHDVVPLVAGDDLARQRAEPTVGIHPAGFEEVAGGDLVRRGAAQTREALGRGRSVLDLPEGELEPAGHGGRVDGGINGGVDGGVGWHGFRHPLPHAQAVCGGWPWHRDMNVASRAQRRRVLPGIFAGQEAGRLAPDQRIPKHDERRMLRLALQRVHTLEKHSGALQAGLAIDQSQAGDKAGRGFRQQPVHADEQQLQTMFAAERRRDTLLAHAGRAGEVHDRRQGSGLVRQQRVQAAPPIVVEHQPVQALVRLEQLDPWPQTGIDRIRTQQVLHDAVIGLEAFGQQRRVGLRRVVDQFDQPAAAQGRVRQEMPSRRQVVIGRRRQQVQHQIDGRTLACDVVLQIGIQLLVSKVEFGGHADQHGVDLESFQREELPQPLEPQLDAALDALLLACLNDRCELAERGVDVGPSPGLRRHQPLRCAQRLAKQVVDFLLRDVQAAKVLVLGLRPAQVRDAGAYQQIDPLELGEQVFNGTRERWLHRFDSTPCGTAAPASVRHLDRDQRDPCITFRAKLQGQRAAFEMDIRVLVRNAQGFIVRSLTDLVPGLSRLK